MTELTEKTQEGLEILEQMLGEDAANAARNFASGDEIGAAQTRIALGHAFADVWGRDGLDRRSRSLVVIGALLALESAHELRQHFKIGLNHGLTPRELEEVVIQSMPYIGIPASITGRTALLNVLKDK